MDHIAASATKYAIRITAIEKELEIAKFERDTLADALRSIIETSDRTYATYSHQQLSKDLDAGRAALALLNKPKAPYA